MRNRQFQNLKFLRQHPLRFVANGERRFLVADFYCHERSLVIEVDGPIHVNKREKDAERDLLLSARGIKTIRASNKDIESDLEGFMVRLEEILNSPPDPLS